MLPDSAKIPDQVLSALQKALAANLHSVSIYGSLARGNAIAGVSDINLLIVLKESTPAAHVAISEALQPFPQVDPFIVGLPGLPRTASVFASKFASIKRNYQLLAGEDVLGSLDLPAGLQRFLAEQALRNLRLRLVYAYVTRGQKKGYERFLRRNISALFVQCSDVLRLSGVSVPKSFEERVPLMETQFGADGQILRDLLTVRANATSLSEAGMTAWHSRVIPLLDKVLSWIEGRWQLPRCD